MKRAACMTKATTKHTALVTGFRNVTSAVAETSNPTASTQKNIASIRSQPRGLLAAPLLNRTIHHTPQSI